MSKTDKEALVDERNFLTPREVREVFDQQLSVSTINELIKAGKIPASKLGRKNLVPVWFVRQELMKGADIYGDDAPPEGVGVL